MQALPQLLRQQDLGSTPVKLSGVLRVLSLLTQPFTQSHRFD